MIIVLDSNLNIVYANQKMLATVKHLLGLQIEVGGNLNQHVENEVIKLLYYSIQEVIGSSTYHRLPFQFPVLNEQFICAIDPIPDPYGNITQIVVTFTLPNVDAVIKENHLLRQSVKRSSSASLFYNKMLKLFTHDLNVAVNNIKMMSGSDFDDDEHLEFIPNIHQSAQHCNAIITAANSLMQYNPDAAGIEKMNVLKYISEIVVTQTEYEDVNIKTDIEPTHEIYTIKPFVRCVFEKLIDNAIQYRSPDSKLKIMITSKKTDQWLTLAVQDNGFGIDLTENGHLLHKPFKRIEDNKSYGVGLYLVHAIMEVMGGKVQIESSKEKGTKVTLYFPPEY